MPYKEELEKEVGPIASFRFIKEYGLFEVGCRTFTIDEFSMTTGLFFEDTTECNIDNPVAVSTPLCYMGTPALFEFASDENNISRVRQDIIDVMVDSFEARLNDGKKFGKSLRKQDTFMGFGLTLYGSGRPALNVLGNCACFGALPDDVLQDPRYKQYDFHNIDMEAQSVALLAGFGHLARIIEEA